jgi:uncharacterized protein (TIGR03067 family)
MSSDLKNLQGAWHITSLETDGQEMPPESFQGAQIVVHANKFTSIGMGASYEGTLEIDESKKPKTFDLVFTSGPQKGTRNLGIYSLTGDSWTICLAMQGTRRPRKFATEAGTGFALETLERKPNVKPRATKSARRSAPAKETTTPDDGAATPIEGEWAMVSGIFNGKALDPSMVKFCKRITRGNVTTVVAGPQTMLKARFTLGTSQADAIDYVNLHGSNKGKPQHGIFERTGNELKICISPPGKPRPADFSSKPGDGRNYTVWRFEKK